MNRFYLGDSRESQLLRFRIPGLARSMDPLWISGPPGSGKTHLAHLIHEASTVKELLPWQGDLAAMDRPVTLLFEHPRVEWLRNHGGKLAEKIHTGCPARCLFESVFHPQHFEKVPLTDAFARVMALHPVKLKPLKHRPEDIAPLATHFAVQKGKVLTKKAGAAMIKGVWPGNAKEIADVIAKAVVAADTRKRIDIKHLPIHLRGGEGALLSLHLESYRCQDAEKLLLQNTLDRNGWDVGRAARLIGWSVATTHSKLKRYGLVRPGEKLREA